MKKWGNEEENEINNEKDSIALISRENEKIYWLREGKEIDEIN
uniref:Uncharacterized protein n=1 Tax=Meloidogyne hapla TaxID=6305 RepID=A0A1I8C0D0_MELHA